MVLFTVLIITHGREEQLKKCLGSLRPGLKPWKLVLVANGEKLSEDLVSFAAELTPHFHLEESPEKRSPGNARNLGLAHAEGEWVFFIGENAFIEGAYWKVVEPLLQDRSIDVLGGPTLPAKDMGLFGWALAIALASPLCTGITFARHQPLGKKLTMGDEEKLTSGNLWVRTSALGADRFPEDYPRLEENFLLQQMKRKGSSMFYHPRLTVACNRHSPLRELWELSFLSGFCRSRLMRARIVPGEGSFWLPSLFVLLHLTLFFDQHSFWALARIYGGIVLAVGLGLSLKAKKPWLFPLVALLHYFVVFLYGLGFLSERVRMKSK